MSTRFEKLQRLMTNVQRTSPSVKHPDQIRGCLFTATLPPGATFLAKWEHFLPPTMPDGIELLPMSPYNYSVEWSARTGDILDQFAKDYGPHATIDFCRGAWESWQAGEWDDTGYHGIQSMTPEDIGRSVIYIKHEGGEDLGKLIDYDNNTRMAKILYPDNFTTPSPYTRLRWMTQEGTEV